MILSLLYTSLIQLDNGLSFHLIIKYVKVYRLYIMRGIIKQRMFMHKYFVVRDTCTTHLPTNDSINEN